MEFLWFDFLALLLLIPAIAVIYILSQRRRRPSGVRYSSLALIRDAGPGSSRVRRHLPFVIFVAALGALILAVARPVAVVAVPSNSTTIILTIDVSGSMCSSDIPPSRLEAAEVAAAKFIDGQASNVKIGIVAFSSYAEVVQAPTNDKPTLLAALKTLATGMRTAIGDGILASIAAIAAVDPDVAKSVSSTSGGVEPAAVPPGDYAADIDVLLTDGESNTGTAPLDAAQEAVDRGVRIYTIGFGTANGGAMSATCGPQFQGREPGSSGNSRGGYGGGGFGGGGGAGAGGGGNFPRGIDEATLQKIADMTGGKYYPAASSGQLQSVFSSLPTNTIVKHEATEVSFAFVGFGGLLAALAMLLGRLWRPLP